MSQRLEVENSGKEKTRGFNFPSDSTAVIVWVKMSRSFCHFLHLYTRNFLRPARECKKQQGEKWPGQHHAEGHGPVKVAL